MTVLNPINNGSARIVIVLITILLLGVFLRIWHLDRESPYWDEIVSLDHLNVPSLITFLTQERMDDPPMVPVFFVLEYYWAKVTGGSVTSIRGLSVILGALNIILIFFLGKALYDATVGLVASLCMAMSITHIYYSAEIRPYALIILLALISSYALVKAIQTNKKRWWLVNIVCNIILMWTHLFTVFFLFAQGLFLCFHFLSNRQFMRIILWGVAQFPGIILLLIWVHSIDHSRLDVAAVWRLKIIHNYLLLLGDFLLCIGAGVPTFRDVTLVGNQHIGGILWRLFIPVFLWVFIMAAVEWRKRRTRFSDFSPFSFLLICFLVPILTQFCVSKFVYACHSSRYIMACTIPAAIFMGLAISYLRKPWLQITGVIILIGVYSMNLYLHPGPWRQDFHSVTEYLKPQITPQSKLLVYHTVDVEAIRYQGGLPIQPENIIRCEELSYVHSYLESETFKQGKEPTLIVLALRVNPKQEIDALDSFIKNSAPVVQKTQFGYVRPIFVYKIIP